MAQTVSQPAVYANGLMCMYISELYKLWTLRECGEYVCVCMCVCFLFSGVNTAVIIQGASVNRAILQYCFFWFGNTGADAAIAIFLPTLKRFSCNGAVDWSTTCFCCKSVLQKRWQFCDRSAWISKRDRDSSQLSCSVSPCHQDLCSKLRGCWFNTKEEKW